MRGIILLFTDFGYDGTYVGQMKAVPAATAPGVPVIDLMRQRTIRLPPPICLRPWRSKFWRVPFASPSSTPVSGATACRSR